MSWQSNINEIRAYIAGLENDLAEVDAVLMQNVHLIDTNPPQKWPRGSILAKAMKRHAQRQTDEAERRKNWLIQSDEGGVRPR